MTHGAAKALVEGVLNGFNPDWPAHKLARIVNVLLDTVTDTHYGECSHSDECPYCAGLKKVDLIASGSGEAGRL